MYKAVKNVLYEDKGTGTNLKPKKEVRGWARGLAGKTAKIPNELF